MLSRDSFSQDEEMAWIHEIQASLRKNNFFAANTADQLARYVYQKPKREYFLNCHAEDTDARR